MRSFTELIFGFLAFNFIHYFAEGGGEGGEGAEGGGKGGEGGEGGGAPVFTDFFNADKPIGLADLKPFVSEELREDPMFEKYGSVDEMVKGMKNLQTMAGSKSAIPDWTDGEAVTEFWGKVGKPEEATGYEMELPENFEIGNEYTEKLREAAFAANLTKAQFDAFVKPMMEYEAGIASTRRDEFTDQSKANLGILSKEWGGQHTAMDAEVGGLLDKLEVDKGEREALDNLPHLKIALGKIAMQLGEHGQANGGYNSTMSGIQDQIDAMDSEIRKVLAGNGRNMNDPKIVSLSERRGRLQDKMLA